ncbi:lipase secretion chaperone [Paraburkholderia megapolitana]|uniref:lipase secretion chaperone n=1 Tax=Paraburkholderia megapolitana TaxID=420953 RepID=UPI0038BB70C9
MPLVISQPVRANRAVLCVAALATMSVAAFYLVGPRSGGNAQVMASVSIPLPHAFAIDAGNGTLGTLPRSLTGSSAPRLPLDMHGDLAKTRAVRDFFDYCLTARNDMTPAELDALVQREIAAQVDGTAAQPEALDVWHRYRVYLDALAKLESNGGTSTNGLDLVAIQQTLDQRETLASREMGDWSDAFFGAERKRQRVDLARLRISRDASLSDTQKAAQLAALDQQMSPEEQAMQAQMKQQSETIAKIAALQKSGATADEMRAQITQTLGPEAAERVVQMQADDAAWQATYADYTKQRAQIAAQGLSSQDQETQIAQLRQRYFTKDSDARRAASLDRATAR